MDGSGACRVSFRRAQALFESFTGASTALRFMRSSLWRRRIFLGELYKKLVDGLVHVVACDADYHIGPLDFEAAFRRELVVVVLIGLVRELHPQPYDAVVVHEELLHFIYDVFFQRICEFEVLSRYDDFVVAHVFLLSVFVFGKPFSGNPERAARFKSQIIYRRLSRFC